MDETKLKPFEKLLQSLEGRLMEGHIFKVGTEICKMVEGPVRAM